ncbi:MAG: AraC family transcriptional regulator [Cellulomonas sp.]|nr:AraC family transcriptional regulator [Cellulomonas sp.]
MDTFSTVLDTHRARGAFVLRCEMTSPWAIEVRDEASVAVLVMVRGTASLTARDGASVAMGPGDVAVVKATQPYVFADRPTTPARIVIGPGGGCVNLGGENLSMTMGLGTRTWGNAAIGDASFVTATWDLTSEATARLLDAMPDIAVIPAASWDAPLVDLLGTELARDLPGQDVVLDRLVDLVLVAAVRHWFGARPDTAPPWWAASSDLVVGQVLSWMHDEPGHPWTLDGLAARAGVSRATLARRFATLVGQSPMAYLTHWRLARGADLLHDTTMTVERIAREVGYASPFSFTTTFKRRYGVAPRDSRARRRHGAAPQDEAV